MTVGGIDHQSDPSGQWYERMVVSLIWSPMSSAVQQRKIWDGGTRNDRGQQRLIEFQSS
jgi:hypothetical protein